MLAIIDGDVLAYQACRPRWQKKVVPVNGVYYVELDEHGKKVPLVFDKEEDREYLEESWLNFQEDLKTMTDALFCNDYLMAVKGDGNFRYGLLPTYKMNRHKDPSKQNNFVPLIRKLAVLEDLAVESINCEADDMMRIWAEEARLAGKDYTICSIDKDLKCIPGKHWNMKKRTLEEISVEAALKHYYIQLIKGDPTDNVRGVPGIGDVKAEKLLKSLSKEEEYQEVVVDQYMKGYGEDWEQQLIINGRMIYLQKHLNDHFRINDWPIVREIKEA